MKVVFISNFMNHHQLPFSLEMIEVLGEENFQFVATMPISVERINMGYEDLNEKYSWIVCAYKKENKKIAKKLIDEADVVIAGGVSAKFLLPRALKGKLIFNYNERFYKKNSNQHTTLRAKIWTFLHHGIYKKTNTFLLCSSAYAAYDASLGKNYIDKTFKWGYFPQVEQYDVDKLMQNKSKKLSILWCGRFLDWKHPEKAVYVAKFLKDNQIDFDMNIIGEGQQLYFVEQLIAKFDLNDCVNRINFVAPNEVRQYMKNANVFLFTSDFNEGWGAVLNEAMNSGCAVVASHAIGSVPFLIDDKKNGMIYTNDNLEELCEIVLNLANDRKCCEQLARNAYSTLIDEWNAKMAATKFLQLSSAILENESTMIFDEGVCSKAEILSNDWRK